MALTRVDTGLQSFPDFTRNQQLANAQIYIGVPGLDPAILANQYQAYVVQENGTQVAVPQPIRTSAGGVPTYLGSPVQIAINESAYSLKVLNASGSQIYYQSDSTDISIVSADQVSYTALGTGSLSSNVGDELDRQRVTPQRYGAVGGGLADDTVAFTNAASAARVVFVPFVSGGYNVSNTVSAGTSTFIFEGAPTQLVGTATAANLNALFLDGGSLRGVPFSALLRSSRIGIVAGAIRQDSGTRTQWNYISDASHVPIGVSGSFATASGASITIPYDKTYSRIISFVCGPDETFANAMGMTVGASVGLSSAIVQASANFGAGFSCRYDGANWIFSQGTGQVINPVFVNYAGVSGLLTIDHEYCRGIGVNLNPWTVSGAILNPYIPCVRSVAQEQMLIQFMDPTTGNVYTGGANTRMAIYITKQNASGLFLDGTQNSDIVNNVDMSSGNIWFYGIFEE